MMMMMMMMPRDPSRGLEGQRDHNTGCLGACLKNPSEACPVPKHFRVQKMELETRIMYDDTRMMMLQVVGFYNNRFHKLSSAVPGSGPLEFPCWHANPRLEDT